MIDSEFEHDRPASPVKLYKYLSPERIDAVLTKGTAKFTKLANTNDIFEVRDTFKRMAGPKFQELLAGLREEMSCDSYIDQLMEDKFKNLPRNQRRIIKKSINKSELYSEYRKNINNYSNLVVNHLNQDDVAKPHLRALSEEILCFSLSEAYDIAPMWAHYAANNSGFIVEFDTNNAWFLNRDDKPKSKLHKVIYFDGVLDEPLQNPEALFSSKTWQWNYEREWRIYCRMDDINQTILTESEPIYLVNFPSDLVSSIIIGCNATQETKNKIQHVAANQYPDAKLFVAKPNSSTHSYDLIKFVG